MVCTTDRAVSMSRMICRAGATNASPAGVSATPRPRRWNRGVPSSRSSSRIECDSDGCATSRVRAALVKLRCEATATPNDRPEQAGTGSEKTSDGDVENP